MMDALTHTLLLCDCLLGLHSLRLTQNSALQIPPSCTVPAETPFYFLIGRPYGGALPQGPLLTPGDPGCSGETSPRAKSPEVLSYTFPSIHLLCKPNRLPLYFTNKKKNILPPNLSRKLDRSILKVQSFV